MSSKFYHTIGHFDKDGKMIFSTGYKFERFLYHLRQCIAFIICPELRVKADKERYTLDYLVSLRKEHARDVRARDKAIARLQKERKNLRQALREKIQ
jgi:hypothetical protein